MMQKQVLRYLLYFIILLAGTYFFVENKDFTKSFLIAAVATVLGILLDLLFFKRKNNS